MAWLAMPWHCSRFKAFRESEAIGSLACLGMSAACAHHARSLRAACRPRARSVLHLSTEFLKTLACHALASLALASLALCCLALACRGLGIAPFKAFRESEAIGSLACRQRARIMHEACAQHVGSVRTVLNLSAEFLETLACRALASLAFPWHVVPWPLHALCCLAMPCLALPCLGMPWPWHCPIQGISRK